MVVFKELVKTDFQLRYQGSFLGMVWSVLKPLMLFAVMYVVFVKFLKFSDGTPTFPDFVAVRHLPVELLLRVDQHGYAIHRRSWRSAAQGAFPELHHRRFHHYGIHDFSRHQSAGGHPVRFLRPRALHLARAAGTVQHPAAVLPWIGRGTATCFPVCILPRCGAYLGSRVASHVLCDSYHLPDFHGGE